MPLFIGLVSFEVFLQNLTDGEQVFLHVALEPSRDNVPQQWVLTVAKLDATGNVWYWRRSLIEIEATLQTMEQARGALYALLEAKLFHEPMQGMITLSGSPLLVEGSSDYLQRSREGIWTYDLEGLRSKMTLPFRRQRGKSDSDEELPEWLLPEANQ
jgi:hypothetical protein